MCVNYIFSLAEKLKREFDKSFGAPWNVICGEAFSFNVDYDFHFLYYFLYGPVAILAWRVSLKKKLLARKFKWFFFQCGSVLPCEINHITERKLKPKGDAKMMRKKREVTDRI